MDREKVLKGLECCRNRINPDLSENEDSCKLCPYAANDYACSPWELYDDILSLLKEQEPVKPEMEGGGSTWWHVCGECHGTIDSSDSFCRHCGRPVKQT
jgi:hypothetical protein